MNHQRVPQQIPMAPQQAPTVPTSAPQLSPFLALQGMIGNAGVLDLLRSQVPRSPREWRPSALPTAAESAVSQSELKPQLALPSSGGLIAPATDPGDVVAAATGQASDPTRDDGTWWDGAVDWTVGGAENFVEGAAGSLAAVPVLGDVAQGLADASRFQCDAVGGAAKAIGDMVGGITNMGLHPLKTAMGVGTMLEHIPFSPLKPLAGLYDVATGNETIEESCSRGPLDDLGGDLDVWEGVGGALIDPYQKAMAEGKPGEAVGRGIVDIGSLFLDIGVVNAAGEGAEVAEAVSLANKTDDAVKVASRINDIGSSVDNLATLGKQADDLTTLVSTSDDLANLNKVDSVTKVATQVGCEGALGSAEGGEGLAAATEADGGASVVHAGDNVVEKVGEDGAARPPGAEGATDAGFNLDPKKHDYFFGKVEKPPETLRATDPKQYEKLLHNYNRSQQMKGVFEGMGILDNPEGRQTLEGVFEEGLSSPVIGESKGSFGTAITRAVDRDGVILEVKYFYEGGEMTSKPKVVTVIPKVKK